jgi:hypothetical protein
MKKTTLLLLILLIPTLTSCNKFAKKLGGSITVELEKNEKLVSCSWKENSLWVLKRTRHPNETPEQYEYKEYSNYGIVEGTVHIKEK